MYVHYGFADLKLVTHAFRQTILKAEKLDIPTYLGYPIFGHFWPIYPYPIFSYSNGFFR